MADGLKPGGRTLKEFLPLTAAEEKVKTAARYGSEAKFGDARPTTRADGNAVRGAFIRFLALGGDGEAPVHEAGVRMSGAWIEGEFDFANTQKAGALSLSHCLFERELVFTNAEIAEIALKGSFAPKLSGSGMKVRGCFEMNEGFEAAGEVDLISAAIGVDLTCSGGSFNNPRGEAIVLDKADIKGGLYLNAGFNATGIVRLDGATVGDNLDCDGGAFARTVNDPPAADDLPDALSFDGANIKGDVFLRDGFVAAGLVSGRGATIGGNLECIGMKIDVSQATAPAEQADQSAQPPRGRATQTPTELPIALRLDGATIKAALKLEDMEVGVSTVSLRNVSAGVLHAMDCDGLNGVDLKLAGMKYSLLEGRNRISGREVIAWLDRQGVDDVDSFSLGQPWEQAIKSLRDMGHFDDARDVAIAKQDRMRRAGLIPPVARAFHAAYGLLAGYGHRPLRVFLIMATTWLLCGLFYAEMAERGVFAPPASSKSPAVKCDPKASPAGWYACDDLAPGHVMFQPFIYSLELSLPLLDFGQRKTWAPITHTPRPHDPSRNLVENWRRELIRQLDQQAWSKGDVTRLVTWLHLLAGWIGGGVIAAMVAGLAKRRDE